MAETDSERLRWLVFGDDWGRHPSTTQHLVRELLHQDEVVWVGSIGMRPPSPSLRDLRRILEKLRPAGRGAPTTEPQPGRAPRLLRLTMLPWHGWAWVRRLNRVLLRRALRLAGESQAFDCVLYANPVAVTYAPRPRRGAAYLRLDDYARLPGVEPAWVQRFEPQAMRRAQRIFATARGLLPGECPQGQAVYLPQGVEHQRFASIPLEPPESRVIGFFGLIESWVDFELIEAAARALPEWQFEFIGAAPVWPDRLCALPNVNRLGPCAYAELPAAIAHWRGAWIPFVVNELTLAVNPVKLREYLAAGLPSFCTPLPEAGALSEWVSIGAGVDEVRRWCSQLPADNAARRQARREAMQTHGWAARARQLREAMLE